MYFNNLLFNTSNIKYFILIYIALKLYKQYNQIIYPTKKKATSSGANSNLQPAIANHHHWRKKKNPTKIQPL